MKNCIVTLVLGLLTMSVWAQTPPIWVRHTPEECVALIDSMLQGAKREYQPDSLRFPEQYRGQSIYHLIEKGATQTPKMLAIAFKFYMGGENKSLEIKGTPTYKVQVIQGPYLDLFSIWQKQFKPDADPQTIAQEGGDNVLIEEGTRLLDRFIFEKTTTEGSEWRIFR